MSVEAVTLETVEAGEMELQAAAQTCVLVTCKSAALQSLSLLCCDRRHDAMGTIRATWVPGGKLPVKPQSSLQAVLVFYICLCSENGWREVLETESGYLEQKEEAKLWQQRLENQHCPAVLQLAG